MVDKSKPISEADQEKRKVKISCILSIFYIIPVIHVIEICKHTFDTLFIHTYIHTYFHTNTYINIISKKINSLIVW